MARSERAHPRHFGQVGTEPLSVSDRIPLRIAPSAVWSS